MREYLRAVDWIITAVINTFQLVNVILTQTAAVSTEGSPEKAGIGIRTGKQMDSSEKGSLIHVIR